MSDVLAVSGLTKQIGQRTLVDGITFEVRRGEIFGLLGPNGAGKTTTIRMLVGLAKPTSGSVKICGFDIERERREAMRQIGTIVENPELYPYLTGYENLVQFAMLTGNISNERIAETIRLVGLEDRIQDKVRRYSLGMRQRLGLAQALLHSPSLLILDEPTNGLDPSGIREFRELLLQLTEKGTSILISSHLLAELEMICDRVGVIHQGKWITTASLEELHGLTKDNRLAFEVDDAAKAVDSLRAAYPALKVELNNNGEVEVRDQIEELNPILDTLLQSGIRIRNVERKKQTLEDIFIGMTGGAQA